MLYHISLHPAQIIALNSWMTAADGITTGSGKVVDYA